MGQEAELEESRAKLLVVRELRGNSGVPAIVVYSRHLQSFCILAFRSSV